MFYLNKKNLLRLSYSISGTFHFDDALKKKKKKN